MIGKSPHFLGRLLGGCAFGLLLVGIAGCGSKGTLHGKVTYNNNPLPKGTTIVFIHEKTDKPFTFEVKSDDGSYTADGLPLGDYKIVVKPYTPPSMGMQGMGPGMGGKGKSMFQFGPSKDAKDVMGPKGGGIGEAMNPEGRKGVTIPAKYLEKESTTLTVSVKGGKQEHPIVIAD